MLDKKVGLHVTFGLWATLGTGFDAVAAGNMRYKSRDAPGHPLIGYPSWCDSLFFLNISILVQGIPCIIVSTDIQLELHIQYTPLIVFFRGLLCNIGTNFIRFYSTVIQQA